jgi:nicotinate phosphoribosyltransferase
VVAHYSECSDEFKGEPLLRPILTQGELVETLPGMQGIQKRSQAMVAALPRRLRALERVEPYSVELSPLLRQMAEFVREEMAPAK